MKRLNRNLFLPSTALLLVCLIAYLPLSSFLFALKNDAFIYNFPNKFFFSEALHAGVIPFWNPYLNYGFPLYADPGFAWWQPITWIFGLIGYNAYTFTIEVLLYIYIAGLGMYWLGTVIGLQRTTAFAISCMFMCSGFFIGNLQHINFLTCTAFLPWLTGAWLKYQRKPSTATLIWSSVATYLLCTGGHPAIPIATLYFFLLLTILYYSFNKKEISLNAYLLRQLKLLGCSVLLLLPLLLSYWQLWPFYSRSLAVVQSQTLNVGFTLPSYISLFLPFGTIKNNTWFDTDVSMRNAYFSLAGILVFIQVLFTRKKNNSQYIFLFAGAFMLLLAAGGTVKNVLYNGLPALNFIRTNGEFRTFAIFSFIVCLSFRLNDVLLCKMPFLTIATVWFKMAAIVLGLISLVLLFFIKPELSFLETSASLPARVKFIFDHLTFYQTLFIASTVACLLAIAYLFSLKRLPHLFLTALLADLILNSWLLLPITGVSQHSVAEMQAIITKSPKHFLPTVMQHTAVIKPVTPQEELLIGNWNWYSKQLVYTEPINYPSMLKSTEAFLQSADTNFTKDKPAFFLKSNHGQLVLAKFEPGIMNVDLTLHTPDTLIVLQNNFPGWKARANGMQIAIQPYLNTFMQLPIDTTIKHIIFRFSPF